MKNSQFKLLAFCAFAILILFSSASFTFAETSCKREGCDITITIKMAFSGTDNATINKWVKDIEDTWGGNTFGECKCPVHVKVAWENIGNASCQSNYTTTKQGYHCINVSNTTHVTINGNNYRGVMWGVSKNGSSLAGFWGTSINQPLAGVAGDIHDAAHEAGHMMGLDDEYNASTNTYPPNIMGRTWGNDTKPTQGHIDQIVGKNCKGEDVKCPDECCCGNGKKDKDEECDPKANPTGCNESETCTDKCKCVYSGYCGDKKVAGDEECDFTADPTGCDDDEECTEDCECKEKPKITVKITEPDDDDEIDEETDVDLDIDSDNDIEKVRYYIDGDREFTDENSPWEWSILPWLYDDDNNHELKVIVYDEEGYNATDIIEFETFWWDHCGNGLVDENEECDELIGCAPGFECNEYCTECEEIV